MSNFTLISQSCDIEDIEGNFTQACKFSPDGLCLLTSTASDHILRLYNTPTNYNFHNNEATPSNNDEHLVVESTNAVLKYKEGDCIRDYTWYPKMNSYDPSTCVFLSTSKESPLHLIDAYNSELRASYLPMNDKDELSSPMCSVFSPDGSRIFTAGQCHSRSISVFHTMLPGKCCDTWRLGKSRKSRDGQKGMISALAMNEDASSVSNGNYGHLLAVGTRNPSSIYLYDDRIGDEVGEIHTLSSLDSHVLLGHGKNHSLINAYYPKRKARKRKFVTHEFDAKECNSSPVGSGHNGRDATCPELTNQDNPKHNEKSNVEESEATEYDFFSIAKQKWYQRTAKGTGINQLTFGNGSSNSHLLYSSARRSNAIIAWDLRMLTNSNTSKQSSTSMIFHTPKAMTRESEDTNQTLLFDIHHETNRLFAPSRSYAEGNSIKVYDSTTGIFLHELKCLKDDPNGVSLTHLSYGKNNNEIMMALSLGSRRDQNFETKDDEERNTEIEKGDRCPVGEIQFYKIC